MNWDQFFKKYQGIYKALEGPETMTVIGEFAAAKIRLRTRLGLSVKKTGANPQALAPLKPSTKKGRSQKPLNQDTRPNFSNLTETGQLLDSIGVTSVKKGEVTVGPSGGRSEGKLDNRKLGYYQTIGDNRTTKEGNSRREPRPFNNISRAERVQVKNFIAKLVAQFLKRGN
jgi:hypothetical protein